MRAGKVMLTGIISSFLAIIMVLMGFMPQVVQAHSIDQQFSYGNTISYSPSQGIGIDLQALLDATTDPTDTDGDGLRDSVEWVLGTDPENADSDFDRLDDYWEIDNGLNPMEPDSNHDGLPDYYEVNDVSSLDIDGDGIPNAWDSDNDGDGVNDAIDLSPFVSSNVSELYHFDITTNGNPTYITFQLIPNNPEHLKLFGQVWDWPDNDREASVQDWDNSKEDVVIFPILQLTANITPNPDEVIMNGIVVDGDNILVPLMPITEHGDIVAFAGRMVYPTATPLNLILDARLFWKIVVKNDLSSDNLSQETLLVTYEDGFTLTGMNIEQSDGTNAGLFYSPDINQTVAANLLLSYQFLRNSANHVADVPGVLSANNISVSQQLASFGHRDAALVSIANEMIPAALDSLPADQYLPVVTILEDSSTKIEFSEFEAVSSDNFSVDLTTEPVITTRSLKASWYNTSDRQAMPTGDVMVAIHDLGLSVNATSALMTLMLYWTVGEQRLEGPGIPPATPGVDYATIKDIVDDIVGAGLGGLEGFYRMGEGLVDLEAYEALEFLQSKGLLSDIGSLDIPELEKMGDLDNFKSWVKQSGRIHDSYSFFKSMDDVLEVLDAVSLFADAGFTTYSVVSLAQMSDLSAMGLSVALLQVTMEYYYNCMLFMIGSIPYVGWLIALSVELSDIFGDWSGDFIDWVVDLMSDLEYCPTPDVEIVGDPSITVDDTDDNGLDVGDRIFFGSNLKGIIQGTEYWWYLVTHSNIYPYYDLVAPGGSNSTTGFLDGYGRELYTVDGLKLLPITASEWSWDQSAGWQAQEYESGMWIEPGTAMPNFPVYVQTNAYYHLLYQWEYFSWNPFSWGWHSGRSTQDGYSELGGFTFYVDVMPGTIADFAQWSSITPLDHDGDGLKDSAETQSNPWLYDTDGDGLNDKYEVDIGTDPTKYDTDLDGLIDGSELQYNCNPNNPDTDGDGLKDSLEVSGWVITFTYGGQEFTMHVTSDPLAPDSDGDGVDDSIEYWSDLNPRSSDTDGDGMKDVGNSKFLETQLQFEQVWNMEEPAGQLTDFALDSERNLYILRSAGFIEPGEWTDCMYKYDSNGDFVTSWFPVIDWSVDSMALDPIGEQIYIMMSYIIKRSNLSGTDVSKWTPSVGNIDYIKAVDVDKDGLIYIAKQTEWWQTTQEIKIMRFNTSGDLIDSWGSLGNGQEQFQDLIDIAVDDTNGYLYVIDQRGEDTRIARFTTDGDYLGDLPDSVYNSPKGIDVDTEGNIYVANTDNHEILKFNPDGVLVASMGEYGNAEGSFISPFRVMVDSNNDVYVADYPGTWPLDLGRIQKFSQVSGGVRPEIPGDVPDRDGDGLLNEVETNGWDITFTDQNGIHTIHVISDPLMTDTDLDGLTDFQEHEMGTDPQDPDTDNDGLSDLAEWQGFSPQTDPRHFDSDVDGLPDGIEISYGSNPNTPDTDGEGLSDAQEFSLGSNPSSADTDGDGLNDADEEALNSNLSSPDSDGDFIFDGEEVNLGTNLNLADTDNDGLSDGMESVVYNTNPKNGDSDGDGLSDSKEVELHLNPLSSDTDGDGVPDGTEVEQGTNPLMGDSDHDEVPDNEEVNNVAPVVNAGPDATIDEGNIFTSSGSFNDPDIDSWYAGVDYGDGSGIQPLTLNQDKAFALSHVYSDNGTYIVTVTVADDHGGVGSDNVTVTLNEPEYITVMVDIKPGGSPNSIQPNSKGVIPVAILTTPTFDARSVDPVSVCFGPAEGSPIKYALKDVDKDGDIDLILHFRTQDTGIKPGDIVASLTGTLKDGRHIIGTDSVRTVPPRK